MFRQGKEKHESAVKTEQSESPIPQLGKIRHHKGLHKRSECKSNLDMFSSFGKTIFLVRIFMFCMNLPNFLTSSFLSNFFVESIMRLHIKTRCIIYHIFTVFFIKLGKGDKIFTMNSIAQQRYFPMLENVKDLLFPEIRRSSKHLRSTWESVSNLKSIGLLRNALDEGNTCTRSFKIQQIYISYIHSDKNLNPLS